MSSTFPFDVNPETVIQVLLERAEQLRQEGDRMLQVEIDRAMWVVAAHQNQTPVETTDVAPTVESPTRKL